ncbi:hypothetical protein Bxe_C0026 [Paraburkholderia xenovorans LB400]|uniref:Uncharacterized protein n=1 Tax=Paraburkholderia xenovorans (strain LB400) TaxID=266265 RepID=Q13IY6_PARXL|nr:hypothetical protein Bxe_C0026 [Paraburkholderia xenovorans LB400]
MATRTMGADRFAATLSWLERGAVRGVRWDRRIPADRISRNPVAEKAKVSVAANGAPSAQERAAIGLVRELAGRYRETADAASTGPRWP